MISDCVTLGTVNYSRRPPNKKWIYGYGKLETVSSLFVAGILLGTSGAVFVHISNAFAWPILDPTPMNCSRLFSGPVPMPLRRSVRRIS